MDLKQKRLSDYLSAILLWLLLWLVILFSFPSKVGFRSAFQDTSSVINQR